MLVTEEDALARGYDVLGYYYGVEVYGNRKPKHDVADILPKTTPGWVWIGLMHMIYIPIRESLEFLLGPMKHKLYILKDLGAKNGD